MLFNRLYQSYSIGDYAIINNSQAYRSVSKDHLLIKFNEVSCMGFKEVINKYFNNHSESSDNHWDPELRTKYFKTNKDKAFDYVLRYFRQHPNAEIHGSSEPHGEISINFKGKRRAFIVVTVIMVRPQRTAIDFSIMTEGGIFDLGFSHNLIKKLYDSFMQDLQVVDTKNHP